jgi:hypothetical protein
MVTRLLLSLSLVFGSLHAEDDTPVPPEVKSLVEQFLTAFKAADTAAMTACWHSPEVLSKLKRDAATAESGTSPTPIDAEKEAEKELRRQTKNMATSLTRAAAIRDVITKHFGDLAGLTFLRVELDEDDDSPATLPAYDGVEIYLKSTTGTELRISVDDAVKVDGIWKFRDKLEDELVLCLDPED